MCVINGSMDVLIQHQQLFFLSPTHGITGESEVENKMKIDKLTCHFRLQLRSNDKHEDEGLSVCVSQKSALHVGDIRIDLREQRQYENNHASGAVLHSNLF